MNKPPSPVRPPRKSQEKARRARVKVDLWCEVEGAKGKALGHVRNLTLGGCRVLSPAAFPKGEIVMIVLQTSDHDAELRLSAEIRWLGLNPEEGPFELGCRFVHKEESADRIEKLLRAVVKRVPQASIKAAPARKPGSLDLVFASEGLDRLLRPGLSAPPTASGRP